MPISTVGANQSSAPAGILKPTRVASVDVFRGLTMLLMIFVNDLAGVPGLPWWNYHAHANQDVMTYVDMVFPIFLFIVGLSIPLAINSRLAKGDSALRLWQHILARTASLLILGIGLANVENGTPALMHMSQYAWGGLLLVGAILFWNVYPRTASRQPLYRILKISGLILIVAMFAIFRRTTPEGHTAWLDLSYWEILGLIGWTYLAVCILYVPTRKWRWSPAAWLVLLCILNACSAAKWIPADAWPFEIWPWNNGAFGTLTMAGVVTSQIFLSGETRTFQKRALLAAGFGLVLLGAGWLSTPLGISKIRATPAWALCSAGAGVFLFLLLYWICDVQKKITWTRPVRPAGANTLLTYLLPDLFEFAIGTAWIPAAFQTGLPGACRSLVFTAFILAAAAVFTRLRVRLQL